VSEDRNEQSGGDSRPPRRFGGGGGGGGRSFPRRKVCGFCVDGIKHVDYKDVPRMRRFISDRGMIEPRRKTGTCAKHQRSLTTAIKRARHLALLSFTEGGREPRDRGGRDRDRGPRGGGRFGRDRFEGGDRGDRGDRPRYGEDRGDQRAPQQPSNGSGTFE
jgi:small subunit ribosomal protein S18